MHIPTLLSGRATNDYDYEHINTAIMKRNKTNFIKAMEQIMNEYLDGGHPVGIDTCALCKVTGADEALTHDLYYEKIDKACKRCPLHTGKAACNQMLTFPHIDINNYDDKYGKMFKSRMRAEFFRRAIEIAKRYHWAEFTVGRCRTLAMELKELDEDIWRELGDRTKTEALKQFLEF